MPLALDPSETFAVSLETDAKRPEAERPAFRFRHLSSNAFRAQEKLLAEWDAWYKLTPKQRGETRDQYEELMRQTYAMLQAHGAGTVHLIDLSDLSDALNDAEARELLEKSLRMNRLDVAEKKGSGSPLPGAMAGSAPAPAPKSAPVSPAGQGKPQSSTVPPAAAATPNAKSAAGKPGSGS